LNPHGFHAACSMSNPVGVRVSYLTVIPNAEYARSIPALHPLLSTLHYSPPKSIRLRFASLIAFEILTMLSGFWKTFARCVRVRVHGVEWQRLGALTIDGIQV